MFFAAASPTPRRSYITNNAQSNGELLGKVIGQSNGTTRETLPYCSPISPRESRTGLFSGDDDTISEKSGDALSDFGGLGLMQSSSSLQV